MLKADEQKWTSGDGSSSEERAVKDRRGSAAPEGRGGSGGVRFKMGLCGSLSDRWGKDLEEKELEEEAEERR